MALGSSLDGLRVRGHFIINTQFQTAPCKVREVRSHHPLRPFSQFSVPRLFLSDVLQYLRHVARESRCFLGLLLTVTSDQNSVYFSKAASSVMQRQEGVGEVEGNNLSTSLCPHYKWKLNLTHTTPCLQMFKGCLQHHEKQEAPDLQITPHFTEL